MVQKFCKEYDLLNYIPRPVSFYSTELQVNKRIAAEFFIMARELQLNGKGGYREWAFRKAGWIIDDIQTNLQLIYNESGVDGFKNIKGIGQKLADYIEMFFYWYQIIGEHLKTDNIKLILFQVIPKFIEAHVFLQAVQYADGMTPSANPGGYVS